MADAEVLAELVTFLTPTTRLDVRRAALDQILGISGSLDGSASGFFLQSNVTLGKAICNLCESSIADRTLTFAVLTNFASGSPEVSDYILSNTKVPLLAYDACKLAAPFAANGSKLLANLSRHSPDRIHQLLTEHDAKYMETIFELIAYDTIVFLGYIIVNVASVAAHRTLISGFLNKVYPLLTLSDAHREIAADILRNLAFDEG
ncbi:unnamed protein product [Auanema sp. JU1783]|nr:unnamed protein product [Auanema sp. JU1783]